MSTTEALLLAILILLLIPGYFLMDGKRAREGERNVYLVGLKDGRILRYEVVIKDHEDLIQTDETMTRAEYERWLDELDNMIGKDEDDHDRR